MTDLVAILAVSITALLATSMDNLAILVALYARFRGRALLVTLGHLAATAVVVVAAWFLGESAAYVPIDYVGLLGLVPLAIGLYWLYRLLRGNGEAPASPAAGIRGGTVIAAAAMSLAGNSVDTVLTMAVVFADSKREVDGLVLLGAMLAALLLAELARRAVANPALGPIVERYSQRIAPFVMIGIGVYVLANTATDILPAP